MLLLPPLTPDEVRRSTPAPALGGIRWAVLDCPDASRLNRLRTRSPAEADGHDALADGPELRELGLPILRNDATSIDAAADLTAQWARSELSPP